MSRRGDGGGNRGVRTENSISSKEEEAKTKQTAAEVWYYSKSYSVCRKDMKSTLRSGKACKAKYCASNGGMSE